MNKLLPLGVITSMLLTGCGGSDSGGSSSPKPPSAPKYTWQMIHLYETDKSNVGTGCAIFEDLDDSSNPAQDKVIAAVIPSKHNYSIIYHNADGSIVADSSIVPVDSGTVKIDSSIVPQDGYVTLEVVIGSIQPRIYSLSIQKPFLQDLVLNANVDTNVGSLPCYKGVQKLNDIRDFSDNAVNLEQLTGNNYYQTSYINKSTTGQMLSSKVPVLAPLNEGPILGTILDLDNKHSVIGYSLIPKENVFDQTLEMGNLNEAIEENFVEHLIIPNPNSSDSLTGQASIDVIYNDNIYLWQPVNALDQNITYNDNIPDFSQWALTLQYDADYAWKGQGMYHFNNEDIALPEFTPFDFSSTTISSSQLNMDASMNDDFNIQRTQVRALTTDDADYFQTIFALPNANQVFMASTSESLKAIKYEVEVSYGKINIDSSDEIKYFLNRFINETNFTDSVRSDLSLLPNFSDVNGVILTNSEQLELHKKQMKGNFTLIQNTVTIQ